MAILLIVIILLGLIFDYINGFHDSANSIATIVSTKVLTPLQAVIWAAFFNFIAFFISKYYYGGFGIADTISKSVHIQASDPYALYIVLAAITSAIIWDLLTWLLGIPSSSSHALIGGLIGAAVIRYHSFGVIVLGKVLPTIIFIIVAPFMGLIIAFLITTLINYVCKKANPYKAEKWFKKLQLLSSALISLGHGGNDAQKTMGLIAAAMVAVHYIPNVEHMPDWVPLLCFIVMGLGTMSGGWRIVKTMGTRITKVTPVEGVAAETAGAITLFISEHYKVPVSTTHTIAGAIMGVGATKRLSAVRWGVTINLLWAWILTIPVSALLAGFIFFILHLFF